MATRFAEPPKGEPKPPIPEPQTIASKIGTAILLVFIIFSPMKWSMETAMGTIIIATTTLGKKMERMVETKSHTVICCLRDVPMKHRVLMASRLSSPVLVQVRLMRSEPTKSTTISEKYWLMIWLAGTKSKMALMPMGSRAVTAMSTGLVIHHIPIQIIVPSANALLKPK